MSLAETDPATLASERERASAALTERERLLGRERDDVERAGDERQAWIVERGGALSEKAVRALSAAIDVADIERIRDRGKFHSLVDATVAPIWTEYANDVAGHVARALDRIAKRGDLRVADFAAVRLGGEPGTGAWSRDLASGIASTIVLGAIGGPTVSFVAAVAAAFGAHRHGAYMKRELGNDAHATFFPAFEADVAAFVAQLARDIRAVYADVATAIERERVVARAETLGPIERALERASDPSASAVEREALRAAIDRLGAVDAALARSEATTRRDAPPEPSSRGAHANDALPAPTFDADAYDRGLRPERYRVVILGALRRGKSSLINAIAGTRLLQDDAGVEALFPVHVRYGEAERAYALEREGAWKEIPTADAMTQAARTPVLIETPWKMPRQLVLVHAPAFDSGNEAAQEIALAAARAANEVVGLFSRQLSDRELDLYGQVAEFAPMSLVHTIADNETSGERRTVVELAARYVRERGIAVTRIFTISALDFLEAAQTKRAAAGWNELGALRDTLQSRAEEHMQRRERRLAADRAEPPKGPPKNGEASKPSLRSALDRFLGRS
jgi:hypothetical protein